MPFADIDDHDIYYEVHGDGPRTVILTHGFVMDHDMWSPQVAELAKRHRVIVWDERGHGMTDCRGPFDFWDSASDLMGLLDKVGAEKAVLVGMSQGGWVSLRATLKHPERVEGLVFVDSATQTFPADRAVGLREMGDIWCTEGPIGEVGDAMFDIQFVDGFDGSVWLAKWRARPPKDWRLAWDAILNYLAEEPLDERLKDISCPSAIIHGREDTGFPLALAEEMAGWLPQCRELTVIDGANHCTTLTHPDQVNGALLRFLESI
jgi:pimeloyl-ACP methyl ester carboxylesterase